jgi:hypothetical protein
MFKLGKQFSSSKRNFNRKGWTEEPEPEIKTRQLDSNKWINNEEDNKERIKTRQLDSSKWIEDNGDKIKTRQLDSSKWEDSGKNEFEKQKKEYLNEIQEEVWKPVEKCPSAEKCQSKPTDESIILIQKIVRGWLLRQNVKYRYCDMGRTKKVLYYPKKNRKTWYEMCRDARITFKDPPRPKRKTTKQIAEERRVQLLNYLCDRIWVHSNKTLQNRWEEIHTLVYSGKLSYEFMEEHLIIKFYNNPKKRNKMYNRYKTLKNKKNPLETQMYRLIAECYKEFL